MKRFLTLIFICLCMASCSSEIQENRETRSTVYKGQSTWDMYENFGAPNYAIRVSPNEVHFIYRREEVTRDWTKMYFDWCDKVFVTVDDYITDWEVSGNQCYLNVADPVDLPDTDNPRKNVFEKYKEDMNLIPENTYYPHPANNADYNPEDDETWF